MSSHALFQAAQIIPINSHISAKTLSPKTLPKLPLLRNYRRRLVLRSYSASPSHIDSDTSSASSLFERCYAAPSPPSASHNVNPVMKGKYGAFGALTLETSKVEFAQQQSNKSSPEDEIVITVVTTSHLRPLAEDGTFLDAVAVLNKLLAKHRHMNAKSQNTKLKFLYSVMVWKSDERTRSNQISIHPTKWFLRDLTGMLGGILFTFYQGSNLDSNAKMWRLVADLMNDLGMLMDLISPLFPSAFVFIVCLGSISRSFTGVASGATRAALTQHFALQDNAADISAKEGSQETVATMIGMALGMLVARITIGHH
ncbi:hypothetical protein P8452_43026 [Trifolium repens]|nr:hypothetical protein P8452_43026 [Trifolium repens]